MIFRYSTLVNKTNFIQNTRPSCRITRPLSKLSSLGTSDDYVCSSRPVGENNQWNCLARQKGVIVSSNRAISSFSRPSFRIHLPVEEEKDNSSQLASNLAKMFSTSSNKKNTHDQANSGDKPQARGADGSKPAFCATKEELKARLSPIQYQVTQLKSTERPFTGEYNKFDKRGTYHCIVCNQELFKSETKFEPGCGWPAFFDSIDKERLKFVQDFSLVGAADILRLAKNPNLVRTEVLCKNCDAHLGHRFDDGPLAKGGKRYCINSAALKFEPHNSSI